MSQLAIIAKTQSLIAAGDIVGAEAVEETLLSVVPSTELFKQIFAIRDVSQGASQAYYSLFWLGRFQPINGDVVEPTLTHEGAQGCCCYRVDLGLEVLCKNALFNRESSCLT